LIIFILPTIGEFSEEVRRQLQYPIIIISVVLAIIGLIIAIKDKEIIHTITDERTKKVDKFAGYYSWWMTLLFVFLIPSIGSFYNMTLWQYAWLLLDEMWFSIIFFHMYFNFKGKF